MGCLTEGTVVAQAYIRRMSPSPLLQTTEDSIRSACDGGCMHAVLSEVSASFRDDTVCAQSTHSMFGGTVMVAMGDAACAVMEEAGAAEELCFVGVTNVRSSIPVTV